jgi:hypothetical protein
MRETSNRLARTTGLLSQMHVIRRAGDFGVEVTAELGGALWRTLRAPIRRIGQVVSMPYSKPPLESQLRISPDVITAVASGMFA